MVRDALSSASPPYRIKREIVAALSQLTCVRQVASFGSLAEGRADAWSDVDLLVACEEVERSAWIAAAAIRAAKAVIFYWTFTGVAQPSGRYWFAGELPFNRVDISFASVPDFVATSRAGHLQGHPITLRTEYMSAAVADAAADARRLPASSPLAIGQAEVEAGRQLYLHLEAVKDRLRGRRGKHDSRDTREELRRVLDHPVDAAGATLRAWPGSASTYKEDLERLLLRRLGREPTDRRQASPPSAAVSVHGRSTTAALCARPAPLAAADESVVGEHPAFANDEENEVNTAARGQRTPITAASRIPYATKVAHTTTARRGDRGRESFGEPACTEKGGDE